VSDLVTAETVRRLGVNRVRAGHPDFAMGMASIVAAADAVVMNPAGMAVTLTAAQWAERTGRVLDRWFKPATGNRGGVPELAMVEYLPVLLRIAGDFERAVGVLESAAARGAEGREGEVR
jgi:hypothetical protein